MVKNTNGGNKSKGLARKHNNNHQDKSLRLSSCDLEVYGVVTKILGNGMFYVDTDEHKQLIGHIRNKFRGRSKRDNSIALASIVLIGFRDWEFPNFKNCDLLEVYDHNELNALNKIIDLNWHHFQPDYNTHNISFDHLDTQPLSTIKLDDIAFNNIHDLIQNDIDIDIDPDQI
jgi:hypothetical protein